jgi:hypothetical protein
VAKDAATESQALVVLWLVLERMEAEVLDKGIQSLSLFTVGIKAKRSQSGSLSSLSSKSGNQSSARTTDRDLRGRRPSGVITAIGIVESEWGLRRGDCAAAMESSLSSLFHSFEWWWAVDESAVFKFGWSRSMISDSQLLIP